MKKTWYLIFGGVMIFVLVVAWGGIFHKPAEESAITVQDQPVITHTAANKINLSAPLTDMQIKADDVLTWYNADANPLVVRAEDGTFSSGPLVGQEYQFLFGLPGTYTVVVETPKGDFVGNQKIEVIEVLP